MYINNMTYYELQPAHYCATESAETVAIDTRLTTAAVCAAIIIGRRLGLFVLASIRTVGWRTYYKRRDIWVRSPSQSVPNQM